MSEQAIKIPDLGGADAVKVIEILVKPGDTVSQDQTLITLESEKATMEIPSTAAGQIKSIAIKVGDSVQEGQTFMQLTSADHGQETTASTPESSDTEATEGVKASAQQPTIQTLTLPDLGTDQAVTVIEVLVKSGDSVESEQTLLTLESEKASMDIPAPMAGRIESCLVKQGDQVKSGHRYATLLSSDTQQTAAEQPSNESTATPAIDVQAPSEPIIDNEEAVQTPEDSSGDVYAGPGARRLAKALGVPLSAIKGTGHKSRITTRDIEAYAKGLIQTGGQGSALPFAPAKQIDFTQFGPVETQPLSRIKQLSGQFLHRNWVMIPHVSQHGETDITELEAYRQQHKAQALELGIRLTPLVFIMKAVVASLKAFPLFNSSLHADGKSLVMKSYYHIGVAVDTPEGLVVPVVRDVDKKTIGEIAKELTALSEKARTVGLSPKEMQGSCFTISSLGGIGGHYFTPIINAPDVAILGVSKSSLKPLFDADKNVVARLMLPLSLSYDHRVIDGAQGARFFVHLCDQLTHFDRALFETLMQTEC